MPALILTILLIPVFWALLIRPQQRRQREHLALVEQLAAGDRVEAFSGIHGTLVEVGERTVRIEVAPGVVLTMARLAVAAKLDGDDQAPEPAQTTGAADLATPDDEASEEVADVPQDPSNAISPEAQS